MTYLGQQSPLSIALIVLYIAFLGTSVWYLRIGTRRQRLWRLLNRSWSTRPARRFHPVRRSDYLRTAGKVAAVGVALASLFFAAAMVADAIRPRESQLLLAISFGAAIGAVVAFAGALGQLWRAAMFRERAERLPFIVLSNRVRVGTARFVAYDEERHVFAGPFRPEAAFEKIHPTVRLLAEAYPDVGGPDARRAKLDEYMEKRGALKLELLDAGGVLVPTREISILDFSLPGGEDVFRIDVEASWEEWEARGLVGR